MKDLEIRRDAAFYRCPNDLSVDAVAVHRVILIGSCLMGHWEQALLSLPEPCASDMYLAGAELPEEPARPAGDYDFQILHLPLRSVLPDMAFARLAQNDILGHERLFAHCVSAMREMLRTSMQWNLRHHLLTFVLPFIVPQQNFVGRLQPRFTLCNPVFFIERLNEAIGTELLGYSNAYFFDLNEVFSTYGRRYVQEDAGVQFNHGSIVIDFDFTHDQQRLEAPHKFSEVYEVRSREVVTAAWYDLLSMLRTIRQANAVKLVVIDLDDTLWRGSVGDLNLDDLPTTEGWPRGLWEALAVLKRRGVLLAIISQNDEARVNEAWSYILGNSLTPQDFAVRRIDWRPKPAKMEEVLKTVNLLPGNVVYVDDNPAQRSEMAAAFPRLRLLGGDPFTWRHILLWASETQVAEVTAESLTRTQMVQAQSSREDARAMQSRDEFLLSLNVQMNFFRIRDQSHPKFPRALELINKTNQFNTTGERWTRAEMVRRLEDDLQIYSFELSDSYTAYGLVGVLLLDKEGISQFVMSCRVMGLEAELAAVMLITRMRLAIGRKTIFARLVETDRNLPCRNVFQLCGFDPSEGGWTRSTMSPISIPAHITITAPPPSF